MKKNLTFIFFLLGFIALVGSLPIKAVEVNVNGPYIDTPTLTEEQIYNLSNTNLLLEFLRQGGTIDVGNTSSDYSNNDLFDDFGDFVRDVLNGRDTGIDLIDFINPFQSEVQYNGLHSVGAPKSAITNFMGWLPFYALSQDNDNPTPNPDVNYYSYIDTLNYTGFYWQQFPNVNRDNININGIVRYPPIQTTWCTLPTGQNINNMTSNNYLYCYTLPVTSLQIFSTENNQYSFELIVNGSQFLNNFIAPWQPYDTFQYGYVYNNGFGLGGNSTAPSVTYSSSGTLDNVLYYITCHFRNVNLYVDGELWAFVDTEPQTYTLDISTGTTIATNDYDYVHWVYDYEIFFRIDRIWDLVEEILNEIRNPSDPSNPRPTVITWTDFEDVIYDVDGNKAVGVKILTPDTNIDEDYIYNYGPLVPVFVPLFTPVINDSDIVNIIEAPMDALPSDLLDVFGYIFIGSLFVCFIHRLLE